MTRHAPKHCLLPSEISDDKGAIRYSRIVALNGKIQKSMAVSVINPFSQKLHVEVTSPANGRANIDLINLQGNVVKRREFNITTGVNAISIDNTDRLPAGVCILRVEFNGSIMLRKITKT